MKSGFPDSGTRRTFIGAMDGETRERSSVPTPLYPEDLLAETA